MSNKQLSDSERNNDGIQLAINNDSDSGKVIVEQIQLFTASCISMLELLCDECNKYIQNDMNEITPTQMNYCNIFMTNSKKLIKNLKEKDMLMDYSKLIKRIFNMLKKEKYCEMLLNKDPELFNIRDEQNKIIVLIPDINIKLCYKLLKPNETVLFWQYMHLFCNTIFKLVKINNKEKFSKYTFIEEAIKKIETDLAKTGILFNNKIFNPFIGVVATTNNLSVDTLFSDVSIPNCQSISITDILDKLGVGKLFDKENLIEHLKNIGPEHIETTSSYVSKILGDDNEENSEIYKALITDLVDNLKINGIEDIDKTFERVAKNAHEKLDRTKLEKTANNVKNFMSNGENRLKDLKDPSTGNPIGEQILNSKMFNMIKNFMGNDSNNESNNKSK